MSSSTQNVSQAVDELKATVDQVLEVDQALVDALAREQERRRAAALSCGRLKTREAVLLRELHRLQVNAARRRRGARRATELCDELEAKLLVLVEAARKLVEKITPGGSVDREVEVLQAAIAAAEKRERPQPETIREARLGAAMRAHPQARVIAAAPELLETCRAALRCLVCDETSIAEWIAVTKRVQDAIAKAEGSSGEPAPRTRS